MRPHSWATALAFLACVFLVSATPRGQNSVSFEPLGLGPSGIPSVQSEAWDASADGSVVVGEYWEPNGPFFRRRGFRWQAATGMQDLGALNPNAVEVQPLAVSADGSKIVGWARGMSGSQRPFLWTSAGGMRELVEVPGTDAVAVDISSDGRVIAGHFLSGAEQAFRWRDGAVTPLGFLPNEPNSFARAVCGVGDAIVGSTQSAGGRAFRWTVTNGMQELPALTRDAPTYPLDCSADATIAVGSSGDGKGLPPVRWDPNGVRSLGTLGGNSGEAHGVSADGAVAVGAAGLPFVLGISEFAAFRWTVATKIEQLSKVLQNRGVTTPFCHDPRTCPAGTWFVQFALGISANGNVIVGAGLNPNDMTEAYRAVVPTGAGPAPAPPPPGACPAGFTQATLTVNTAVGAAAGTVVSNQTASNGSKLTVSSGQSAFACFQSNKTLGFQALNNRIADWSGTPAISCKNGNAGKNLCEFTLGTASQSVTATLK